MRLLLLVLLAACGSSPAPGPGPTSAAATPRELTCQAPPAARRAHFASVEQQSRPDAVRAFVARCARAEIVATTSALVRCQTVSALEAAADGEHACLLTVLRSFAEAHDLTVAVSGAHDAYEVVLPGRDRAARKLLFVAHGDVVPVNDPPALIAADAVPDGWSVAPFTTSEREGRLYGRGTEDDKGPIASALVVLAALRAAGIEPAGDVALAIGNDEEHGWDAMQRYAASAPHAEHTISIDGAYPVVVAQSGFVAWGITVPQPTRPRRVTIRRAVIVRADGGLFLTQVPDSATALIEPAPGESQAALLARVRAAATADLEARAARDEEGWGFEAAPFSGARLPGEPRRDETAVELIVRGVSAHSSTPEDGRNALWALAAIAQRLELEVTPTSEVLAVIARTFDGDHHGERAGLAYSDELMGPLFVAPTKLRTDETGTTLSINMRRPRGKTAEEFRALLDAFLAQLREGHPSLIEAPEPYIGEPHVAATEGPLVQTLLGIYRTATGEADAQAVAERGGTYARLFPGAVDFGPSLPGRVYRGHGADEYVEIDTLVLGARMYLDAVLTLGR